MKSRTCINMNDNPLGRINTYGATIIKKEKEKEREKEKIEKIKNRK